MRSLADAEHDISVDGPELAAQAIRADLVDEFQMIVCPAVVGGGKRFFPDGRAAGAGTARGAPVRQRRAHPAVRHPQGCSWAASGVKSSEILPA
jgi:dihydrofolate reductase